MRFKLLSSILLSFFICFVLKAQEEEFPRLDEIIEEIASSSDVELDYLTLFTVLEDLYYNPINLNTAGVEDLRKVIFLTEFQIHNIILYRDRNRGFQTLYELQFVVSLDILTIKRLLPFVSLERVDERRELKLKNALRYGRSDLFVRYQRLLQEKRGYAEIPDSILELNPDKNRYLGCPNKVYTRYGYRYRDQVYWGITAEKDDGEQFFRGAQKYGFDFYSAHFQINNIGRVKKLIIGDFLTEFGQGLTLWSGMSFGKTSQALNIIKRPRGINRYTSVNENEFFRGTALTLNFGDFDFTGFVSYKPVDGSVGVDTTYREYEEYVSSFLNTGYHRTPSEIVRRKTVQEFVTGGNVTWNTGFMKIGATGVYTEFSVPFNTGNVPYRYFEFEGKSNANFGVDYITSFRRVNLFGEMSMSRNLGYAMLHGAVVDLAPEVKMSVIHRHYEPNYQALYSVPFSEGNRSFNESGTYLGFEIFPIRNWSIDAYFDSWKYPWLRYGVHGPSTGYEYLVQLNYYPKRYLDMYFRYKHQHKLRNNPEDIVGMRTLTDYELSRYRYQINYKPDSNWRLQNRIEVSQYNMNNQNKWGYLIYQDVQYRLERIPMILTIRLAIFETVWDTRIYAYEPDVLYAFSVPAYYSHGIRTAFVIKYSILDNLDMWFKIADTYFHDQNGLGQGLDYIEGKNRTDIKLQIRYKF